MGELSMKEILRNISSLAAWGLAKNAQVLKILQQSNPPLWHDAYSRQVTIFTILLSWMLLAKHDRSVSK